MATTANKHIERRQRGHESKSLYTAWESHIDRGGCCDYNDDDDDEDDGNSHPIESQH